MGLGLLALTSVLLALAPPHQSVQASTKRGSETLASYTKIKHVVLIYQENHTFDDVLGTVCQARPTPCDGYVGPVTFADGNTAGNVVRQIIGPGVAHDPDSQKLRMRNAGTASAAASVAPYYCVSHVDPANMPNLTALANTFTVSDATFAAGQAASFGRPCHAGGRHLRRLCRLQPGQLDHGEPPARVGLSGAGRCTVGPEERPDLPALLHPGPAGDGPYRESRVPYAPTIMERLESAGPELAHLRGPTDSDDRRRSRPSPSALTSSGAMTTGATLEHDSSALDFTSAAAAGTLPNLSILIPDAQSRSTTRPA